MDIDQVTRSTNLGDLGLDSLGTTALMGTLRVSIPPARKLTMSQLTGMETIGDLVDALDAFDATPTSKDNSSTLCANDDEGEETIENFTP